MNKKIRSLRENFFARHFLALSTTAVLTKTTLFSLRSSILLSTKITAFTPFISRFKNHSKKIDKKGLLQYSSSSRKKFSRYVYEKYNALHKQEKCLLYFGSFLQEFSNETASKDSDFCTNLLSCQFFINFATQLLNQHKKSFANGLLDLDPQICNC